MKIAKYLAGHDIVIAPNAELADLARERRGVMLLYPVQWYAHESLITVGFGVAYPPNTEPKRLVWGIRQSAA